MITGERERPTLVHPTDFGPQGALAFAHAVRLALRGKYALSLLHIATDDRAPRRSGLREVADLLVKWNMLPANASPDALARDLDMRVVSNVIPASDARAGILHHLDNHPCDLAVIATRNHRGLSRWLERSLANRAVRKATTMILMVREGARGFVDPRKGAMKLDRVLVPVDASIDFMPALARIETWLDEFGPGADVQLLHVGASAPTLRYEPGAKKRPLLTREGPVAETILQVAHRMSTDLIAMPTAKRSHLLAALRGSVTAEILDDARWPVLSAPAHL